MFFLAPALVVLGVWVVYPAVYTIVRSFFGQQGFLGNWVGIDNYKTLFTTSALTTAIKNNAIWVAVVPAFVTAIGLIFAVLTERSLVGRVQDRRLPADGDLRLRDRRDLADDVPAGSEPRRDQRPRQVDRGRRLSPRACSPRALPSTLVADGDSVGRARAEDADASGRRRAARADRDPARPVPKGARRPSCARKPGDIVGIVWRDFKPGGGKPGVVEKRRAGLPGATVELRDARVRSCSPRRRARRHVRLLEGAGRQATRAAIGA